MSPEQHQRLAQLRSALEGHDGARPPLPVDPEVPAGSWREADGVRRLAPLAELAASPDPELQAFAVIWREHLTVVSEFKAASAEWDETRRALVAELGPLEKLEALERAWRDSCAVEYRRALVEHFDRHGATAICAVAGLEPAERKSVGSFDLAELAQLYQAATSPESASNFAAELPSEDDHAAFSALIEERRADYEQLRPALKGFSGGNFIRCCARVQRGEAVADVIDLPRAAGPE